jgi:hypothetical protein
VGLQAKARPALLPFLLMIGGLAFIGAAIWLGKADSPLRRWLQEHDLPAVQRDALY